MKKHVFFQRLLILVITVAMIFSLTSCSQQRKPIPTPSKSKQTEQNKPPKELDKLSKAVEKIEKTLSDMHERSKKPLFIQQTEVQKQMAKEKKQPQAQQQGKQQGQQQDQGGGQGKQQGGGGSSGSSSGGGQQQAQQPSQVQLVTPEEKLLEPKYEAQQAQLEVQKANMQQMEQLKKDVLELHSSWNAFESKAENQLLMQTSLIDFENGLNNLTKSIQSNDVYQSLLDVTQLYKYLPDFYIAYSSETPPEIGKIRFGAKKIVLLTEKGKFPEATETFNYMANVWMLIKAKLPKDSMDKINQMEFSLTDLKDAIDAKNPIVVKAKAEVMIKIADELEKGGKGKSQQKSK